MNTFMSLCLSVSVLLNVTLQRTNLFAGDGGGKSKQQENNMVMQISQPVQVMNTVSQQHVDLSSLESALVAETQAEVERAAKRSKVETQNVPISSMVEASAMNVAEDEDDVTTPENGCAVAELSLEGLDAQLFDHSPLGEAESIGNLSVLSTSGLLDSEPNFLALTSLQREDSLGVCMALATQDPIQEKSFAAHDFAFTSFNDLQSM